MAGQRKHKIDLLRKIAETLTLWRQSQAAEAQIVYSPQERLMRAILGITLVVIGLVALGLGLTQMHASDLDKAAVAMFLVFGGEAASLSGAWLTKYYFGSGDRIGKAVFGLCFVASVGLMIFGLIYVFTEAGTSVFLLIVGFIGALLSALALK